MATIVNLSLDDKLEAALDNYRGDQRPILPKNRAVEAALRQYLTDKGYLPKE